MSEAEPQREPVQGRDRIRLGMPDYSKYSFWLETSGDDLTPRPALANATEADVVVLGVLDIPGFGRPTIC